MDLHQWEKDQVYEVGTVLAFGDYGTFQATRTTKGERPIETDAWVQVWYSGTPKADLAESLDNRIGRGA